MFRLRLPFLGYENQCLIAVVQQTALAVHSSSRVEHDSQWLTTVHRQLRITHGQRRIVCKHRADSREYCGRPGSKTLHIRARRLGGDPFAFAAGERRAPIDTRADLDGHPRRATSHARKEPAIQLACIAFEYADRDLDSRRFELAQPAASHSWIGVRRGHDDSLQTRSEHGVDTGRRAAMMRARLERHVGGAATRASASLGQRIDLCMRLTGAAMPALAHHIALRVEQDAADARIRRG